MFFNRHYSLSSFACRKDGANSLDINVTAAVLQVCVFCVALAAAMIVVAVLDRCVFCRRRLISGLTGRCLDQPH
jgi:hypothetical protein